MGNSSSKETEVASANQREHARPLPHIVSSIDLDVKQERDDEIHNKKKTKKRKQKNMQNTDEATEFIVDKPMKNLCKPVTANRTTSNNHTISETIHNTYIAQVDTAVSHEQIPLHALQPISSETTFPRENEDIVEVKNKKRRKRKRKQEVYGRLNKEILYSSPSLKTSLTSQKGMTIEVRNKKRTNKKCKPEGNGRSKQESEIDVSNLAPSLKTSLTSQKGMIIGVKNKKRTNKKRKPEGNGRSNMESEIDVSNLAPSSKTSLTSQKFMIIGDDGELLHCDGHIILCVSDRRLSRKVCEAGKVVDDELVHCNGYIIHCMNDKKRQNKVCEAARRGVRKEIVHKPEELSIINRLIADGKSYNDTRHIFNMCVQNGNSLCCRYLFKCNQWICSIPGLVKAVKTSIGLSTKTSINTKKAKHVDTAKAISWQISRMFYLGQQMSRKIKNIYPAFKCICKNKSSAEFFCSDFLYIVVVVVKIIPSLPKNYEGILIYQKVSHGMCTEGERIKQKHEKLLRRQLRSVCLLHGVSSQYAHHFFSNHSNLFSIVPSLIRSKSFKTRNRFTVEKCATFTCGLKGFIPIGERHFPDSVFASDGTKVKTDVIEGSVNLTNLMVGDHIESTTMSGTLGGILLYYNRNCFITCAHVMLDEQSMISRKNNPIHNKDLRVFVKDANGQKIECGNALRCDFETGSDTKPGIDVAVIEMKSDCKVNPNSMVQDSAKNPHSHLYLGMSNEYLNDNYIDYELLTLTHSEVDTMAFGQLTTVEHCKTVFGPERMIEVELKNLGQAIASANGSSIFPVMIAQPAHFQVLQGPFPATTTFRMYNQLCLNVPLVPGDSGTCIYIRNCPYSSDKVKCKLSDKNGKCPHSGCLGMAIAFSNGMSIVTPLKKIFEYIL